MMWMDAERLYELKPRSIMYLFSGGKDSSLALILTRNLVKKLCEEIGCRVYVIYIYVTKSYLVSTANNVSSETTKRYVEE
jgi:predicted phosphoadenosine phosphosulfate sulfurtransferase